MGKGSSGQNTVVQQSQPPQQFLNAYQSSFNNAQNVAGTPFQQYPGGLVAPFSPDQLAGIQSTQNANGVAAPYLNTASQYIDKATQPLLTSDIQNYINQAGSPAVANAAQAGVGGINRAAGQGQSQILGAGQAGANGAWGAAGAGIGGIDAASLAGVGGIQGASGAFNPNSIQQFVSPYTQSVVNATQQQFNQQNQEQQSQLAGNAASQGAWGGDRSAVAQALLAGQQQQSQAPVIAGLENQGYQTGVQAAETAAQQQLQGATSAGQLGLQGASTAGQLLEQGANAAGQFGLQGASGAGQLGLQGATSSGQLGTQGAAQQAALQQQAAAALLGANEAQGWLGSQAGYGMANLGNEALSTSLGGANALLGIGGLEQQQAQQSLNVPYEQFIAQQAYPFQTAGWLANIGEGLGSASGGLSSTTYPGASIGSQVAGAGLAGAGLLSQAGAFGSNGFLSGMFGGGSSAGTGFDTANVAAAQDAAISQGVDSFVSRGGAIRERGGMIPHRAVGGVTSIPSIHGGPDVPQLVIVPNAGGMAAPGGSLADYLSNVSATAFHLPPPPPRPPPPAAAPAGMADMGAASGGMGNVNGEAGGGNGGAGGGNAGGSGGIGGAGPASGGTNNGSATVGGSQSMGPAGPGGMVGVGPGVSSGPSFSGMGALSGAAKGLGLGSMAGPLGAGLGLLGGAVVGGLMGGSNNSQVGSFGAQYGDVGPSVGSGFASDMMGMGTSDPGAYGGTSGSSDSGGMSGGSDEGYGGGAGDTNGGMGGMYRKGGIVRRDDGGDVPGYVDDGPMGDPSGGMTTAQAPSRGGNGSNIGNALLYAGLGIMSGRSPNMMSNIGSGALEGLKLYTDQGLRERQIALQEQQGKARAGLEQSETNKTNFETERNKAVMQLLQQTDNIRGRNNSDDSAGPAGGNGSQYASATQAPPMFAPLVQQASQQYGVPEPVANWLFTHESGWNASAKGPMTDKGWQAAGIGQMSPDTAKQLGVDPLNPSEAIPASLKYLRGLYDQTGNWEDAVARYGTFSSGRGNGVDQAIRNGFRQYAAGNEPQPGPQGSAYQVASNAPIGGPSGVSQGAAPPMFNVASLYQQAQRFMSIPDPQMIGIGQKLLETASHYGDKGVYLGTDGAIHTLPGYADSQAQIAGAKSGAEAKAEAPYKIAENLMFRAGAPITAKPGEAITTGFNALPQSMQDWVGNQVGISLNGQGQGATGGGMSPAPPRPATPFQPSVAPMPGTPNPTVDPGATPAASGMLANPDVTRSPNGALVTTLPPGALEMQRKVSDYVGQAPHEIQTLREAQSRLVSMQGEIEQNARSPAFLQSGWKGDSRTAIANSANTLAQTLGMGPVFSQEAVANNQSFVKNSSTAAFALARSMAGGRVAVGEVLQANRGTPNMENSVYGNIVVNNLLMQENQRQIERARYAYQQTSDHGADPQAAADKFDQTNPPWRYVPSALASAVTKYAETNNTTAKNVSLLHQYPNKSMITAFDNIWGQGVGEAILQGGQ